MRYMNASFALGKVASYTLKKVSISTTNICAAIILNANANLYRCKRSELYL